MGKEMCQVGRQLLWNAREKGKRTRVTKIQRLGDKDTDRKAVLLAFLEKRGRLKEERRCLKKQRRGVEGPAEFKSRKRGLEIY
jgi:hypothetical protein